MPQPNQANPEIRIHMVADRTAAFRAYKERTGAWPVFSMTAFATRYVLMLAVISGLFWYGRLHAMNGTRVTIYALVALLPFIFVWNILETLVWNYDLRRRR